jgi:hypothetical protein
MVPSCCPAVMEGMVVYLCGGSGDPSLSVCNCDLHCNVACWSPLSERLRIAYLLY